MFVNQTMSLINFVSGKTIEDNREALRNARSKVLKTAEEKFYRQKEKEERAKRRGEDKWMLPSLEKKLEVEGKHKHSKHKKHKKKKKKRKRSTDSSSSSESNDDEEWVEKCAEPKVPEARSSSAVACREEWMNMPISVPTICIDEARAVSSRKKNDEAKKAEEKNNFLDQPGQTSRELNPYWKDGGSGLPGTSARDRRSSGGATGDFGDSRAGWLRQAAAEQGWSARESLVGAEGSSVNAAWSLVGKCEKGSGRLRERREFQRPGEGDATGSHVQVHGSANQRWKKNAAKCREAEKLREQVQQKRGKRSSSSSSSDSEGGVQEEKVAGQQEFQPLSDKELNELGARLVKAEIMGNESLAVELKKKLERGRAARTRPAATTADESREETVLLTKTGPGGLVYPLRPPSMPVPCTSRRRKHKMATHEDGKRVRYFADDDNFTLQEMFEREKLTTVEEQNDMFSKLAAQGTGRTESVDDVFEDRVRVVSEGQVQARDRSRAIAEHRRSQRALDSCALCIDSKLMLKHLLVAIGSKTYLCLPPHQSLTEGHCLLAPLQHVSCATQLDEDVWSELQLFRKALVAMFREMDQDVVFFETAMQLRHFPHMMLHCVPMPRETGDLAPIYFKKAILECEMEWSSNKKVVDLAGKDVRRAVPRGLPYFAVDFGMQSGFAHVIEDEQMFPRNFAQEIIGGMLDLDHSVWRKQRPEKFDTQCKKVVQFSKKWKPFDFTHQQHTDS